MIGIEIGRRNYLLYLLLPHRIKSRLLTVASRAKLDRINETFNEAIYSSEVARDYDRIHRYAGADQHEYRARPLVAEIRPAGEATAGPSRWAPAAATSRPRSRGTPRRSLPSSRWSPCRRS